jgi:hypothetical protein
MDKTPGDLVSISEILGYSLAVASYQAISHLQTNKLLQLQFSTAIFDCDFRLRFSTAIFDCNFRLQFLTAIHQQLSKINTILIYLHCLTPNWQHFPPKKSHLVVKIETTIALLGQQVPQHKVKNSFCAMMWHICAFLMFPLAKNCKSKIAKNKTENPSSPYPRALY